MTTLLPAIDRASSPSVDPELIRDLTPDGSVAILMEAGLSWCFQ